MQPKSARVRVGKISFWSKGRYDQRGALIKAFTVLNTDESSKCERETASGARGKGYCQTAAMVPKRTGVKAIRADQVKAGQAKQTTRTR